MSGDESETKVEDAVVRARRHRRRDQAPAAHAIRKSELPSKSKRADQFAIATWKLPPLGIETIVSGDRVSKWLVHPGGKSAIPDLAAYRINCQHIHDSDGKQCMVLRRNGKTEVLFAVLVSRPLSDATCHNVLQSPVFVGLADGGRDPKLPCSLHDSMSRT